MLPYQLLPLLCYILVTLETFFVLAVEDDKGRKRATPDQAKDRMNIGRSESLPVHLDATTERAQRVLGRAGFWRNLRAESQPIEWLVHVAPHAADAMRVLNRDSISSALVELTEAQRGYHNALRVYWRAQINTTTYARERFEHRKGPQVPKTHQKSIDFLHTVAPRVLADERQLAIKAERTYQARYDDAWRYARHLAARQTALGLRDRHIFDTQRALGHSYSQSPAQGRREPQPRRMPDEGRRTRPFPPLARRGSKTQRRFPPMPSAKSVVEFWNLASWLPTSPRRRGLLTAGKP